MIKRENGGERKKEGEEGDKGARGRPRGSQISCIQHLSDVCRWVYRIAIFPPNPRMQ